MEDNDPKDHVQVTQTIIDLANHVKRKISCDYDIANLVFELNRLGAKTEFSCQEFKPGIIQIGFSNTLSVQALLLARTLLVNYYPESRIIFSLNDSFCVEAYILKDKNAKFLIPVNTYQLSKKFRLEDITNTWLEEKNEQEE